MSTSCAIASPAEMQLHSHTKSGSANSLLTLAIWLSGLKSQLEQLWWKRRTGFHGCPVMAIHVPWYVKSETWQCMKTRSLSGPKSSPWPGDPRACIFSASGGGRSCCFMTRWEASPAGLEEPMSCNTAENPDVHYCLWKLGIC